MLMNEASNFTHLSFSLVGLHIYFQVAAQITELIRLHIQVFQLIVRFLLYVVT